jgi:hypothetical protein
MNPLVAAAITDCSPPFVLKIMDELNEKESLNHQIVEGCTWVPEYGAWMVEVSTRSGTSGKHASQCSNSVSYAHFELCFIRCLLLL